MGRVNRTSQSKQIAVGDSSADAGYRMTQMNTEHSKTDQNSFQSGWSLSLSVCLCGYLWRKTALPWSRAFVGLRSAQRPQALDDGGPAKFAGNAQNDRSTRWLRERELAVACGENKNCEQASQSQSNQRRKGRCRTQAKETTWRVKPMEMRARRFFLSNVTGLGRLFQSCVKHGA